MADKNFLPDGAQTKPKNKIAALAAFLFKNPKRRLITCIALAMAVIIGVGTPILVWYLTDPGVIYRVVKNPIPVPPEEEPGTDDPNEPEPDPGPADEEKPGTSTIRQTLTRKRIGRPMISATRRRTIKKTRTTSLSKSWTTAAWSTTSTIITILPPASASLS